MNRDRFSPTALVAGVLFLGLGAMFLLDALDIWQARPGYVLPILLIGLGLAIIAGAGARRATR